MRSLQKTLTAKEHTLNNFEKDIKEQIESVSSTVCIDSKYVNYSKEYSETLPHLTEIGARLKRLLSGHSNITTINLRLTSHRIHDRFEGFLEKLSETSVRSLNVSHTDPQSFDRFSTVLTEKGISATFTKPEISLEVKQPVLNISNNVSQEQRKSASVLCFSPIPISPVTYIKLRGIIDEEQERNILHKLEEPKDKVMTAKEIEKTFAGKISKSKKPIRYSGQTQTFLSIVVGDPNPSENSFVSKARQGRVVDR